MPNGGFLVKFDGKETERCYAVAFDYDEERYTVNNKDRNALPPGVKTITIEVECAR